MKINNAKDDNDDEPKFNENHYIISKKNGE